MDKLFKLGQKSMPKAIIVLAVAGTIVFFVQMYILYEIRQALQAYLGL